MSGRAVESDGVPLALRASGTMILFKSAQFYDDKTRSYAPKRKLLTDLRYDRIGRRLESREDRLSARSTGALLGGAGKCESTDCQDDTEE